MRFTFSTFAFAIAVVAPQAALACSSCGCTLSSDWLIQGTEHGGFHADLRFDYFNQDDLRSGTKSVDRGSIELPAEQEVQQMTINRNYTLFLDYAGTGEWGLSAQLPWFDRYHTTIAEGDTEISTSHTKSIGDLRLLARYHGLSADHSTGLQFGLKLPTGSIDNKFISGPQEGELLDRGLQPGTGTTDLLVGVYNFGAFNRDWDYFAEAILQQPLNSRDEFRPGTGVNLSFGARYMSWENVRPQFQINVRSEGRESGANADVENSGATLVYFSPGVNVRLTPTTAAYAYVQVPIYQRVNGLQIEPRYSASIGIRMAL